MTPCPSASLTSPLPLTLSFRLTGHLAVPWKHRGPACRPFVLSVKLVFYLFQVFFFFPNGISLKSVTPSLIILFKTALRYSQRPLLFYFSPQYLLPSKIVLILLMYLSVSSHWKVNSFPVRRNFWWFNFPCFPASTSVWHFRPSVTTSQWMSECTLGTVLGPSVPIVLRLV